MERGGEMKEKKVTRWRTADMNGMYLREMAEQGYILTGMNHLTFRFREDEPQYLRYKMETLERFLDEKERAAYAAEGWQEVCHYELEYVFAKERDPFALVDEDMRTAEDIAAEIDQQIEKTQKDNRFSLKAQAIIWLIGIGGMFLILGRDAFSSGAFLTLLWKAGYPILLAVVVGRFSIKRMQKKKERILEGDIPEEYTDWRKAAWKGRLSLLFWLLLVTLIAWVYLKF